jgi:hypothetical protein
MSTPQLGGPIGHLIPAPPAADFRVEHHGSISLLFPLTRKAGLWLAMNVHHEPWQWLGNALACESRFAIPIIEGMWADGLVIAVTGNVH